MPSGRFVIFLGLWLLVMGVTKIHALALPGDTLMRELIRECGYGGGAAYHLGNQQLINAELRADQLIGF